MAYTLANLRTDIRGYTEVSDTVLTDAVLATQIKNAENAILRACLLYTSPSPRDGLLSRMPSSA